MGRDNLAQEYIVTQEEREKKMKERQTDSRGKVFSLRSERRYRRRERLL